MSNKLDEVALQKKVYDIIVGYGRQATFTVKATPTPTTHVRWITPPRASKALDEVSNSQEDTMQFLIPSKDVGFDPYATMKVVDSKDSKTYRVIRVDPIDSGLITTAYRIVVGR